MAPTHDYQLQMPNCFRSHGSIFRECERFPMPINPAEGRQPGAATILGDDIFYDPFDYQDMPLQRRQVPPNPTSDRQALRIVNKIDLLDISEASESAGSDSKQQKSKGTSKTDEKVERAAEKVAEVKNVQKVEKVAKAEKVGKVEKVEKNLSKKTLRTPSKMPEELSKSESVVTVKSVIQLKPAIPPAMTHGHEACGCHLRVEESEFSFSKLNRMNLCDCCAPKDSKTEVVIQQTKEMRLHYAKALLQAQNTCNTLETLEKLVTQHNTAAELLKVCAAEAAKQVALQSTDETSGEKSNEYHSLALIRKDHVRYSRNDVKESLYDGTVSFLLGFLTAASLFGAILKFVQIPADFARVV